MGFVVASFRRNTAPTPKRCTVSVSSSPSSRLRAALGLILSSCRKIFCNASFPPHSGSSHTHCASAGRSLSGSSPAGTPSHSAACESGSAAPPLAHRKHVPHRLAALSIHPSPPDTAAGDPVLGPEDLPTAL